MPIQWTKEWSGTDDGAVVSGVNLGDIQRDLANVIQVEDLMTGTEILQTLTDQATLSWDAELGSTAMVTLAGDRALNTIANAVAGNTYRLIVKQDTTGTRLLTFGANFRFAGGTDVVLTTTASAVDVLEFVAESSSIFHCMLSSKASA